MKYKMFLFLLFAFNYPLWAGSEVALISFEEGFLPHPYPATEIGKTFKYYYDCYRQADHTPSEEYLIPKLIHFIWLGSPVPKRVSGFIETWKRLHPKWCINIWTDSDVPSFGLENKEAFDRASNFGEKSDIFRYEILYRFGGAYVDTDFECLKPLDILHKTCEFYTSLFHDNQSFLNGIIGVKKGHPIMRACIDHLSIGNGDHDAYRIFACSGPYHFTNMFLQTVSECDPARTVIFPPSFFYPLPAKEALAAPLSEEDAKKEFVKPESFTIHYWARSWMR